MVQDCCSCSCSCCCVRAARDGVPQRPLLAPWYRLSGDGDRLLLEHGQSVVALEGAAVRTLLPHLLPLLDGTRTYDDLVDRLGAAASPALDHALGHACLPRSGRRGASRAARQLDARRMRSRPRSTSRRRSPPSVCAKARSVSSAPRRRARRSRACSISAASARSAGSVGNRARLGRSRSRRAGGRRARRARVVEPPRARDRDALAAVRAYDGRLAAVGPLIVPGESCCYECVLLRRAANVEYGEHLRDGGGAARGAGRRGVRRARRGSRGSSRASLDRRPRHDPARRAPRGRGRPALSVSEHVVLRVPRCPVCSSAARRSPPSLARGGGGVSSAARSPRLRRAVSPYTGIVRAVEECLASTAEPPHFRAACEVGRGRALLGASLDHSSGIGGAGLTRREAAAAAVGEALERYSATYVPLERLVVATARRAGCDSRRARALRALLRAAVRRPVASRSGRSPASRGSLGRRPLAARTAACLAARRARVPRRRGRPGPDRIAYATSSGMACAGAVDEALVARAVRAARARRLHDRLGEPALAAPARLGGGRAHRHPRPAALRGRLGLVYAAIDLSVFHRLPSVLGVVRAPAGRPGALGVGAGTAADASNVRGGRRSPRRSRRAGRAPSSQLLAGGDRGAAAPRSSRSRITSATTPTKPAPRRPRSSTRAGARTRRRRVPRARRRLAGRAVRALCARVEAAGSSAYAVDVTSPDVRELGLGVVKVVAPELCMLDVVHAARFLGGRRLYDAAASRGLPRAARTRTA